jgi:AbiV family abortive infection protein
MEIEKLDIFQIINGMFLTLENVRDLIDDAEILLKHKKVPRAYVIAQLANEEIGKAFILYNVYMAQREEGATINSKKIRKDFYDHKAKTFEATNADFLIVAVKKLSHKRRISEVNKILAEIDKGEEEYNMLKNQGLYVSVINNLFKSPKESVNLKEAKSSIKKAKDRLAVTYSEFEREVDFDLKYGTHPKFLTDL